MNTTFHYRPINSINRKGQYLFTYTVFVISMVNASPARKKDMRHKTKHSMSKYTSPVHRSYGSHLRTLVQTTLLGVKNSAANFSSKQTRCLTGHKIKNCNKDPFGKSAAS
jgi:hypothetical protein